MSEKLKVKSSGSNQIVFIFLKKDRSYSHWILWSLCMWFNRLRNVIKFQNNFFCYDQIHFDTQSPMEN